jgi:MFS transporter, DHA1 family, multidrug resistance protein
MKSWKRNLITVWITQILSLTGFGFALPFLPYYIQELGVTDPARVRFWTGIISSAPALAMGVMAPIWGTLADRFGRKIMLIRSMGMGSIIIFLLGIIRSVEAVVVLRVCQGLFTGTVAAAATLVAAETPSDRQSFALGFLSSSTFIGLSLGPFLGGILADLVGYRTSFMIGSIILIFGFLLVLFFIQEHKKPIRRKINMPGAKTPFKDKMRKSFKLFLQPEIIILFFTLFLLRFIRTMANPFIALYIQEIRGTLEGASSITGSVSAAVGLATALAGLTLSRLGDRRSKTRLIVVFLLLGGIFYFPIFLTNALWSFIILYVIGTYFMGGVEPIIQSSLSIKTEPNKRGLLFGVQTAVGSLGWFLAPMVGSVISINLGIPYIFLFLGIFLLMGLVVNSYYIFFREKVMPR